MDISIKKTLSTLEDPISRPPLKLVEPGSDNGTQLENAKSHAKTAVNWGATAVVRGVATPFAAAAGLTADTWEQGGAYRLLTPAAAVGGFIGGGVLGTLGAGLDVLRFGEYSLWSLGNVCAAGVVAIQRALPGATDAAVNGATTVSEPPRIPG